MLAAIDFHALGRVVLASLVAGVGIPVLYSLAIFGAGMWLRYRKPSHL